MMVIKVGERERHSEWVIAVNNLLLLQPRDKGKDDDGNKDGAEGECILQLRINVGSSLCA